MTPTASASLLFHRKKDAKKDVNDRASSPRKATSVTPRQKPHAEPEEDIKLPDGPFQEFRLMSSALNGWKYDVMKFDSRKPVDISTWQTPIRLNRKEPKREDSGANGAPEAVGPMLGPDGKPVIGADGRMVMVDAEGRPIHNIDRSSSGLGDTKGKAAAGSNGSKRFQKKTRQVFLVPETTRQLRREERYPWVMEDSSQKEVWVGKLEEVSRSETHAFFMPAANDVFKFVPAHRWYKFQKKPNYHIPSLEEAETIMAKHQKNKDPERWLLHNRNGKAPSSATSAIFKAESEGRVLSGGSSSLVHTAGQSLAPGGRKLKAVDSGMDGLFGDDDEDGGSKKKREKEYGGEGDLDEQVYEEDFADDEEKIDEDNDDEETKELEERLKREYKNANKQREGGVDESDDEKDDGRLTKDGKAMKKLIRNLEKNNAYDSDEDKNPYASSEDEEEEEEEEPPAPITEPATQQQQVVPSRSGSQTPNAVATPGPRLPSQTGSRATSPAPVPVPSPTPAPSPGLGGHSMVAKRATSPKGPKTKTNNASRGTSPLGAGQGGRAASPTAGSRATSPTANGSRAGSPAAQNSTPKINNKRKAGEDVTTGSPLPSLPMLPKAKKRKASGIVGVVAVGELEDRMVIEWLKNTPHATTRDCIQHFTPYLTDESKKSKFTALVKEVAQLKGGVLVLRNAYRGSGAPSPGVG